MATWADIIKPLLPNPDKLVFISTATNGTTQSAELLCVAYSTDTKNSGILVRQVDRDTVLQGQEYHKVTADLVDRLGICSSGYVTRLTELFANATVFSYNPSFQQMVLGSILGENLPAIYNLPLICKGAEISSASYLDDVYSLRGLEVTFSKSVRVVPPFNSMCKARGITDSTPECFGTLPCVANAEKLSLLWDFLCALPISG